MVRSVPKLICQTPEDCRLAIDFLGESILIGSDIETIPHIPRAKKQQPFVMTVSAYTGLLPSGEMRSFALQMTRQKSAIMEPPANLALMIQTMRQINDLPPPKVLHNGVYDSAWFFRYGAPLRQYDWDTMTLFWSFFPDMPKTLDTVSSIVLDDHRFWKMGRKEEDFVAHTFYAMEDTETTLLCALQMIPWLLMHPAHATNYFDAHRRCMIGLGMSMLGAPFDEGRRASFRKELTEDATKSLAALRFIVADDDLNPNSPVQMRRLFYEILGAQRRNAKGRVLKQGGKASTGAIAMKAMESDHPIIKAVIKATEKAKRPAKQLSNVMGLEGPDNRFRTSYDGIGTTTTRFSSRRDAFGFGGNAQNIRKSYRPILGPDPHCFYFEADFSAADDVFVSYESEDPKKIELVESGKDTHSFNASAVFFTNWTYEQVVAGKKAHDPAVIDPITGIRQITKKTTHGANYLMAGMTLLMSAGRAAIVGAAKHLGHQDAGKWDVNRLAEFCEHLDAKYRRFYTRFARDGKDSIYYDLQRGLDYNQSFTSIFNYTQRFNSDPRDQATLRACAASVGQANTAGRVNMALDELVLGVRMRKFRDGDAPDADTPTLRVTQRDHGCSLRFQTHDSVTYMVNYTHPAWEEGIDRIMTVLKRPVLCKGRLIRVGIEADVAINWADDSVEVKTAAEAKAAIEKRFATLVNKNAN